VVRHLREYYPAATLIGLDSGYFAACLLENTLVPERFLDRQYFADVRDVTEQMLQGVDAIVHLAALPNDAVGHTYDALTQAINQDATLKLADAAKRAGAASFVFASCCSVYGFAEEGTRDEHSEVNPLSAYARAKVNAEIGLKSLADASLLVTCLRFASACGASPRLRLDQILNAYVVAAMANGAIDILSDGSQSHPLIDVADMARAIHWAIQRPSSAGGEALIVNAGSDQWNYPLHDLAAAVADEIPSARVKLHSDAEPGKGSCRVNFELFRKLAPQHQPIVTLKSSIRELKTVLEHAHFANSKVRKSNFMRLNMLSQLRRDGQLDKELRWASPSSFPGAGKLMGLPV
jgi:nucleoside-diphosphate-sugar epimerase